MSLQPIIIAAGRGSRLNSLTETQPKPYTRVGDKPIIDWALEAMREVGMPTPVFIGGYMIDRIASDYPNLHYCHNDRWEQNNILASLFYAETHMTSGFVCAYGDVLFRAEMLKLLLDHPGDIVLCVDVDWRCRYADRHQHPEDDAEKVIAEGDHVRRVSRSIPPDEASGEYIGVAKFSSVGAQRLRHHYWRLRRQFDGGIWKEGVLFEKAYLIHLFDEMLLEGESVHMVTTHGDYMEIDTEEDFALANRHWPQG